MQKQYGCIEIEITVFKHALNDPDLKTNFQVRK